MVRSKSKRRQVIPSSGNVFADLGFQDAEERQTKLRLAYSINRIIERRGWTQTEAARRLGLSRPGVKQSWVNQSKISALRNYRLEGFSVERLMRFLTGLDQDVQILIRQKDRAHKTGQVVVIAA
jgi:predicted XRE-type DNA-binding protein